MSREKDKKNKPLSAKDQQVWDKYAEELSAKTPDNGEIDDFEALLEAHEHEPEVDSPKPAKISPEIEKSTNSSASSHSQSDQIDRRTLEKLRKGQMTIDARLDLHGMRQTEAYDALNRFMVLSVQQRLRCVLIITGKGKPRVSTSAIIEPENGVLKKMLPQWLEDTKFKKNILTILPADKKHGGSGAFYIYLKKVR